jgi:four helix bundle protein
MRAGAHRSMKITRFEDTDAWKGARRLVQAVSKANRLRRNPDPFLARQIRNCSTSIMANIAEGFDAGTRPEFIRFLKIALRSGSELQSHLYVALDESHIDPATFEALYATAREVKALIGGFIRYLRRRSESP